MYPLNKKKNYVHVLKAYCSSVSIIPPCITRIRVLWLQVTKHIRGLYFGLYKPSENCRSYPSKTVVLLYNSVGNLGLTRACKGTARGHVNPTPSDISKSWGSISKGRDQSKACKRFAMLDCTIKEPMAIPGHDLRPAPKGKNWKCWPSMPTSALMPPSTNLFGLNLKGSSQIVASRPMAHTLTKSNVPAGISYPETLHVSMDWWGTSRGTGGWSRSDSLTIAWMYLSLGMSDSCTKRFLPITSSSSACAAFIIFGFASSSAIAHSVVNTLVSVPAPKASWDTNASKQS